MTRRGVFFDMDGVLVDSVHLHLRAYEVIFRRAGIRFPQEARGLVLRGNSRSDVLEIALRGQRRSLKERLWKEKPAALRGILKNNPRCEMPNALETVRTLGQAGVPMAVVTNSTMPEIWLEAVGDGFARLFSAVIKGSDVSSPKPAPEGYLLAASKLGLEPSRCLAVEDSHDGWAAATNAGMRVAVVAAKRPAWATADTEVMSQLDPLRLGELIDVGPGAHP